MRVHNYGASSGAAREFLCEWAARGEVLVLAASRDGAAGLVRTACGHGAFTGIHRFTVREFAMAAGSSLMNARELSPLRQIGREALAARVTAVALEGGLLSYLHTIAPFPGFPRALARTFERLRLNRVTREALGPVNADLAELLHLYERELRERSLADHASRVELALEALAADGSRYRGLPVLALDVEPQGAVEAELLELLYGSAPAVLTISLAGGGGVSGSSLESLQQNLFSGESVPARPADGGFEMFSASGEALECVEIARRILAAAHGGTRFDEMAVLLRDPRRYQPLLAEAFERAGVPAFFSSGVRKPLPSGRAFLALLRCAAENCSASVFAEYLSLGQMPAEEGEMRAPIAWERLLVDAAVIGGADRWKDRIEGLIEEYLQRGDASENASERERCARQVNRLEGLAGFALPLIRRLSALPAAANWSTWIDELGDLAQVSLGNPTAVHALLEELAPMADTGPAGLADVVRVLHPRLSELREEDGEERYGKVFAGSIEDARGLSFGHVFVPGLNEGIFPRLSAEDSLLPETQCEQLGVPPRPDDVLLLRVACACASSRVVISWSRLDLLTGRPRVPSFYAFEAFRSARGGDVDVRTFEDEARRATETRIGWPAPAAHEQAIDEVEFDLAYLRPGWERREKGAASYLTQVNGHAARSLRARWRRWNSQWRADDGLVVDQDIHALQLLGEHRLSKRGWSVSALQQYARCPYRFALKGIVGLEPQERSAAIQSMDAVTRGRMYHDVQFRLLQALREADLLPVTNERLTIALTILQPLVSAIAREYAARLCPAIPQVWDAEVEAMHADLRGWLHYKASLEPDWTPELFEFSFGLPRGEGHDTASVPGAVEALPGVLLKGSIDLVERHREGALRVVDHKTGRPPQARIDAIGAGEHLQPALYALAAERALGERVSGGRLFYSTLRGNFTPVDIPLSEQTRSRAAEAAATIDGALERGFLPAAPREDGCEQCEYLPICGPWEEERVRRKSQRELRSLVELRRMS